MNPPSLNSPPRPQRPPIFSLLLLGSLVVFFASFLYMRVQEVQARAVLEAGSTALAKNDLKQARSVFDTFLRRSPTSAVAYAEVTGACLERDQAALAVEYAERGLEACKNAPDAERAFLYMTLSEAQGVAEPAHPQTKAIAAARAAVKLDPENFVFQNAVGYTLVENDQNLDEADKLLRQALKALKPSGEDPQSDALRPAIEDSFGWLLYKKGDYTGAVAVLTQAMQDMPSAEPGRSAKHFYYHLGAAYRKAGQIEEARRTLAIALQYDPAFAEAKAEAALLPPPNTPAATPPVSPIPSTPPTSATPGLKL
jgi:tetratricopeptide (TPR) repeat protein